MVLHTTEYDVLTDEGLAFAALARQAGASLQHHHHPALPHDFCLYAGKLASSRQAVEQIAAALDIEHKFPCKNEVIMSAIEQLSYYQKKKNWLMKQTHGICIWH